MLPRILKQLSMIAADTVSYVSSVLAAAWLLPGVDVTSASVLTLSAIAVLVAIPVHWMFGLYASIVRYMGLALLGITLKSTLIVSFIFIVITTTTGLVPHPLKVGIIVGAFSLILIVGGRVGARLLLSRRNRNRERVIIYGAGESGAQLIVSLLSGDDYLPVALIDDDKSLHGRRIHGLVVYSLKNLEQTIENTGATRVLLAMPGASGRQRRRALERLSEYPVRVQTVPDIKELVSGRARFDDIRDVDTSDLLGRNEVPPDPRLLSASNTGRNVAVTGAGGSIGAELCRQVLKQGPKRLVCIEISEAALYEVERELLKAAADMGSDCEIVALLGSVADEARMREAFSAFGIQTVYHAAAYKHVPIVEQNIFEGIRNNVLGTWNAVRAAADADVEVFVLISTDKAVNPMNIMGATKRMAELILQAFDQKHDRMRVCMVRFGNVLESSGSVVPLFRDQIRNGGPVTVTHRDIIRYFMTITEAAQLVIQASAMASGGDVFVLDMGKPVRIEDLARRMINLMGLTVRDERNEDGDIEIRFIGLRTAEKLYEELLIGTNVTGTAHPRIMRANEKFLPWTELSQVIGELETSLQHCDYERARELLLQTVKEYEPSNGIDDLVWAQRTGTESAKSDPNVVEFPHQKH